MTHSTIKQLQEKQIRAMTVMYRCAPESKRLEMVKTIYESTVRMLESALGPEAHIADTDQDLFSAFSDCYKGDNGFRPRFFITRTEVVAWFEERRKPENIARLQAQWAEEDAYYEELRAADLKKEQEDAAWAQLTAPLPYEEYDVA